jgi:deoxyribodipyrimidine photo-lyase
VLKEAFYAQRRLIPWRFNPSELKAWQQGLTGYPIVDACMRQLNETGWMHNRGRMIVASFLTKDLLHNWQLGEQYFMQKLVDGDPAANNGGWQWTAGVGTDAAPYFRIFNPILQSKKFDPQGIFIRKWLSELRDVPLAYIHEPWTMQIDLQEHFHCVIGKDYPAPIVDRSIVKDRVLNAFQVTK